MLQVAKVVTAALAATAVAGAWLIPGASTATGISSHVAPGLSLTFDPDLRSSAANASAVIHTQFPQPDEVQGVDGRAWRTDGFSSWISAPLTLAPFSGFTVAGWVALESYPSDREVPTDEIAPASLINQADATSGFDVFVDTFGRWGLRLSTIAGTRTIKAGAFPLSRWVHIAATYDPASGSAVLYLDGSPVGRTAFKPGSGLKPARSELLIARTWRDAVSNGVRINGINAAYDTITILPRALSQSEIARSVQQIVPPAGSTSLSVPATRFATDAQRPIYHAMPSANWTNEPHGLVRRGPWWHLFYQRTPNGPYKTQMHWGHMMSRDLVDWTYMPDALWPTLQTDRFGYDMKGIWSGSVAQAPNGLAYAFYTSVNHTAGLFNPGISVAVSGDPVLRTWQKRGPVLDAAGFRDFRDPIVWFEGGEWRMIVGAAMIGSGGGLAYYRCKTIDDLRCWEKQRPIAPFAKMDIGSDIWEMPVFEPIGRGKHILLVNPIGRRISKYGNPATRAVYWIGKWDGTRFEPDDVRPKMLDIIPGHLSPTVTTDAAGRIVGIGIVDERRSPAAQTAAGWAHTFGLPRRWRLLEDGRTLGQSPLKATRNLRISGQSVDRTISAMKGDFDVGDLGRAVEIQVDFSDAPSDAPYGLVLGRSPDNTELTRLTYDPVRHVMTLDKRQSNSMSDSESPTTVSGVYDERAFGRPRSFHVFVDHSVVDVFVNNAAAFSFRFYPSSRRSTLFGVTADTQVGVRLRAWRLKGIDYTYDLQSGTTK